MILGFEVGGAATRSPFTMHSHSQHCFQHQHADNHVVPVVVLCVVVMRKDGKQASKHKKKRSLSLLLLRRLGGAPRVAFTPPKTHPTATNTRWERLAGALVW